MMRIKRRSYKAHTATKNDLDYRNGALLYLLKQRLDSKGVHNGLLSTWRNGSELRLYYVPFSETPKNVSDLP